MFTFKTTNNLLNVHLITEIIYGELGELQSSVVRTCMHASIQFGLILGRFNRLINTSKIKSVKLLMTTLTRTFL